MAQTRIHHTIAFFLRRWHRRLGVFASLFALWLVASGWALNHTQALGLAGIMIHEPWLMRWYGLKDAAPESGWSEDGYWLVANEEMTLLDGKPLPIRLAHPVGMAGTGDLLFIADQASVAILTLDRQLVEEQRWPQLPVKQVRRIGIADHWIVIEGGELFSTTDGSEWKPFAGNVRWIAPKVLGEEQRKAAERFMQPGISLERVLADLHSGRVLGRHGPYFMDLVGALIALLAVSGVWLFTRRRHLHRNQ